MERREEGRGSAQNTKDMAGSFCPHTIHRQEPDLDWESWRGSWALPLPFGATGAELGENKCSLAFPSPVLVGQQPHPLSPFFLVPSFELSLHPLSFSL